MNSRERNTLRGLVLLLLLTALVRATWEGHRATASLDLQAEDILPELLAASDSAAAEEELRGRRLLAGETLDPNAATEVELDRLPGVGAVTARRIVETRDRLGGFETVESLMEVPGIGERTLAELRPFLEEPRGRLHQPADPGDRGRLLDINAATAAELETLPGIGPALAARIVTFREEFGPLTGPDDLLGVRGIGPATLAGFRDLIRVRDPR